MRPKLHCVTLTEREREQLLDLVSTGQGSARTLVHARILLKACQGPGGPAWQDAAIAEAVELSEATVERVRKRNATAGLEVALHRRPARKTKPRKLDGAQERTWSRWCVAPRPRATGAGACGCWLTGWRHWR